MRVFKQRIQFPISSKTHALNHCEKAFAVFPAQIPAMDADLLIPDPGSKQ
ncbi:hypothetical protein [Xanthomonas sp. A1809]|nr:hypothetical protein [Xanthomonas sp. A1809]MBO9856883.1 hypothetical protein [Xanthomonas sp. A1809]WVK03138.1 hypothetical protein KWH09_16355 [Xanthomonas campestris pv. olitorii]